MGHYRKKSPHKIMKNLGISYALILVKSSQNAEIRLSKVQAHNFDTSFLNQENLRWNKAVVRHRDTVSSQKIVHCIYTPKCKS